MKRNGCEELGRLWVDRDKPRDEREKPRVIWGQPRDERGKPRAIWGRQQAAAESLEPSARSLAPPPGPADRGEQDGLQESDGHAPRREESGRKKSQDNLKSREDLMHYVESPYRLPYEMASGILQAEIGCSYNRCRFCSLCRKPGKDYRPAPREEVEADLDELASYVRRPSRIYLYGGNPFGMPRDLLIPLLERIHEKLPEVKTIGGFCRVADVKAATDEDLATWARLGVQGLSIGAESAYDPALKFMRKPHTAADLEQQCARLNKVGIDYTLFYLAGMAGAEKCSEAARASAEVFSRINPLRINIMRLNCKVNRT